MFVDFHTHVLPGIDDGSESVQQSIEMMHIMAEQGIERVVATPHFYPRYDSPERFLEKRKKAEFQLREALEKEHGMPELSIGTEVYFFHGISDSDALSALTIDNKRYIMIEMLGSPWQESAYRELEDIYNKQGLIPIIAHIDRYITPFRTYGVFERLAEMPVLVQANASFFLNRSTSHLALRRLQKGQIHLLGSDCHNLSSRPPKLGEAVDVIKKKLGQDTLSYIEDFGEQVFAAK